MVENTKVNVRLSNAQLKKLKDAVKNNTGTTLRISLKIINVNNLPHELLLTTRQKTKVRNAFNNNTSTDIKFSKVQINKIIQSGGFLGKLLGPLLKTGLPLIKNVIKPLGKSVLIPLGLTAAASAADAEMHKKKLGSGNTTLIISNEEMNDVIKIVQTLEDSMTKCQKIIRTDPELGRCTIFGPKVAIFPKHFFGGGNYYYQSHLPISPFDCATFRAQHDPFPQIRNFFRKPVNESCYFIHAYLQAKNQSQILIY